MFSRVNFFGEVEFIFLFWGDDLFMLCCALMFFLKFVFNQRAGVGGKRLRHRRFAGKCAPGGVFCVCVMASEFAALPVVFGVCLCLCLGVCVCAHIAYVCM